ncbi:MAG: prolipoprotein diacylglyceryl transferase [Armatimonadetes bacterium]|nr:prolipoprotein diacylglyceryl transferase [Armatimonadota bacterium]
MFPTLFRIGPVDVHSYGTLLMVGFLSAILLSRRQARRMGLSADLPLDLGVWVLVAAVVSARVTFVALNWGYYSPRPAEVLYIWRQSGLSFHGGLLGGVVAGLLFSWRRGLSFWTVADMVAPGIALGYAIARIGCLLNGCCYGVPTELPWGMTFPLYPDSQITTDPSHPTQIYAALGSLAILALLLWARNRLTVPGRLFLLYLMLYSVLRSGIELLRKGATADIAFDSVTQAQVASAVIFTVALLAFILLARTGRNRGHHRENEATR